MGASSTRPLGRGYRAGVTTAAGRSPAAYSAYLLCILTALKVLPGLYFQVESVMEATDSSSQPQEILTVEEVVARARRGKERLIRAGLPTTRNIERRLAWKRARGIDTTAEEQACGLIPR